MVTWMAAPTLRAMAWQWEYKMKFLGGIALAAIMAGTALAGDLKIVAGGDNLFGAKFGSPADDAIARISEVLGTPTGDSGRIAGCEVNGIDERYVDWGGLGAQFYENETGKLQFERWTYRVDYESGADIPGGPPSNAIVLPKGIKLGDRYTDAAKAWGFKAEVDEVFQIGWHFGKEVAIMTADENLNGPIVEIGVPHIGSCE